MATTKFFDIILEDNSKLTLVLTDFITEVHGEIVTNNSSLFKNISSGILEYKRETIPFKAKTQEELLHQVHEFLKLKNLRYLDIVVRNQ